LPSSAIPTVDRAKDDDGAKVSAKDDDGATASAKDDEFATPRDRWIARARKRRAAREASNHPDIINGLRWHLVESNDPIPDDALAMKMASNTEGTGTMNLYLGRLASLWGNILVAE
jgi:hypothetical protein